MSIIRKTNVEVSYQCDIILFKSIEKDDIHYISQDLNVVVSKEAIGLLPPVFASEDILLDILARCLSSCPVRFTPGLLFKGIWVLLKCGGDYTMTGSKRNYYNMSDVIEPGSLDRLNTSADVSCLMDNICKWEKRRFRAWVLTDGKLTDCYHTKIVAVRKE